MDEVEPFSDFFARTAKARPEEERYAEAIRAAAKRHGLSLERVTSEFQRMKDFILDHYRGVTPVGRPIGVDGQTFDCVPFDQQAAVRAARAAGLAIDASLAQGAVEPSGVPVSGIFPPGAPRSTAAPSAPKNPHPPQCPAGTVPLLRITLESMIPFGTLERYFYKAGPPLEGTLPRG